MSRWQIACRLAAVGLSLGTCVGYSAQAEINGRVPSEFDAMARVPRWEACAAPPERTVPTTMAMLGKPVSLSIAPLDALTADLKLDAGQKKRVGAIQDKLEKDARGMSKNARGSDYSEQTAKMSDLVTKADKDIDAELTADQKPLSIELLKRLSTLRSAGIPLETYVDLKLTPEQLKSLEEALPDIKKENKDRSDAMLAAAKSRNMNKMRSIMESVGDKVKAILTKDQVSLVEKYRKKYPMSTTPMFDFGSMGLGEGGFPPPDP